MRRLLLPIPLALLIVSAPLSGCEDDPPETEWPAGVLSYNELIDACVRTAACEIKTQPRLSNCVDYYRTLLRNLGLRPIYDRIFRCVNAAQGDCTAIFACFGADPWAGRCDRGFKAACDESSAITCDLLDRRVYIYDCAHAGLQCKVKSTDTWEATCSKGGCSLGSYTRRCDGDRVLTCYQGVIVVEDCVAQDLVCDAEGLSGARCVGAQKKACDENKYTPSCNGNTALTCVGDHVHEIDCGLQMIDRRCAAGRCVPSGSGCSDQFNRCAGDKLQGCLDGSWKDMDCVAMGLQPCVNKTHGAVCGAAGIK
jgi:hypothetical protein